ncbi:hypothetical protein NIES4071_02890 [Calothrix sp. NIES-4071]|nr:hypothetical protein NIES4071_02890 [Calothrix sp. NIES-4071]BAZ54635.1 hypothetical protein NIES4105_02880 [Calothrix sp. NIES-4105]
MLRTMLYNSNKIKAEDKVLILYPPYVAGLEGIICGQEKSSKRENSKRWLILVNLENFMISLTSQDFILLKNNQLPYQIINLQ